MHKLVLIITALTVMMIATAPFLALAYQETNVNVKKGDWIKYQVRETGNPDPDNNVTWSRIDIRDVEGEIIKIDVQTAFANGTIYPENGIVLNIATGAIGDGFFVPTNLQPGDNYSSQYEGNITITGIQQLEAGGAKRTVLSGVADQTTYYWDKQTGIMVAATSILPDFTMYTTTSETSLWQLQILGLDSAVFYTLVVVIVIILVAVAAISIWRLKFHRKK